MKRFIILISIGLLFISFNQAISQEIKVEKEERVKDSAVPKKSIGWLDTVFPKDKKTKWFKESTSGKTSYEAKFKYLGQKYSVEFSESGVFEDIEFLVNWKSLDRTIQDQLLSLLSEFDKIKIKKTQKNWTSPSHETLKEAIQNTDPSSITERYELVLQGKKGSRFHIWEALLSIDQLISIKEVKLRSTANLDF